ncbi:hypothetical protein FM104_01305 [Microbacterium esteraromaticum]|uniref:SbsA Ig-like domain-containing protein n=1 Tax=Microbacterium esteraromaticum TaxID=57043 RepID=A0A1R4IBL9_9MICO|nr:hypothetical protein [Microbacterium esteraromaticum]SJN17235.1 hypothetical protein FM104_01305 [Microbacterium esteraromaticum]
MSTDGSGEAPLTRAQLRALRAAQEGEHADEALPPAADSGAAPEPEPEPAAPDYSLGADTPDVGADASIRPTSVHSASKVSASPAQESATTAPKPAMPAPKPRRLAPKNTRFTVTLLSVLGVLALVVGVLGVVSLTQGPRIDQVQVNPTQVIETSGSRIIITANQRLGPIDPAQVSVDPAVPFTVDASGRSIGIRFTVPLDDDTKYRVSVAGATASGGGPQSDLETTFRTPASQILLLQRSADGDDKIFTTDLTGEKATPVFEHPRVDDYRATSDALVVAVEEDDGSRLLVMNRDGSDQRELKLPGEGYVSSVQVSDRAGLVGYNYSDRELTETSGRASVLVTQPLSGAGKPRIVQVDGDEASVSEWRFVPDSSSLLFIDFDGALSVEDPTSDAGVQSMGIAASILGISRGTYTAIVERTDGSIIQLDLTDGAESPLAASEPDYGDATTIEPFPGGTLRHIVQRDETGMPTGQAVVKVDDDGAATVVTEVSGTDAILQVCASPSGQYAAVVIAPDLAANAYDDLMLPLPSTLHTQLFDLRGDDTLPTLNGFDISWCRVAPQP